MITDEQLIECLRSAMNAATIDVFPPDGLLDGIIPSPRRRPKFPSLSGVMVVLASASALAIAALAIILLGHARSVRDQPAAPSTPPATRASSLAELQSQLAVLRRAQRPSDRLPAWGVSAEQRQHCSNCLNVARVMPRQTRLLATIRIPGSHPGLGSRREHIYLVLGTVPRRWGDRPLSGWRQHGLAIEGIHLSLVGLTVKNSPQAQPADELLNYAGTPMPARTLTPRHVIITNFATIGVVPDGVRRVKWELANPGQRTPVAVYPSLHGNVAIAPWTPAPPSTSLINEQLLRGATWYGRNGRVIASFGGDVTQIKRVFP